MKSTRRRILLTGLSMFVAGPVVAQTAQQITDRISAQIRGQGFEITRMQRTLLGRVRITARRGSQVREVVFDPRNGAILRDFTSGPAQGIGSGEGSRTQGGGGGGAPGGGGGGTDDDDDDDDGDDGDDDDGDDDDD
ncbi:hypothetical protein V8J82_11120 [Gymnodinialimonas sp. 2305UL16-5]|uniref:hypothetical protein n=1 Tax=Gymnodinialimonas mytili TaxID=3126503 RepID=UPI00309CF0D1